MKKSPICFVAMAFGKDDTDLFYEKQILPVLKRNGVKPVIINRHQSNDDLNIQIFEQLEKADFCIADLTYTRPSVYFEAGYAQRAIPVLYTARKDHLGKAQPDDLRVHFDLQMKPIVDWKNPDDLSFANRLEKRLRATVLRDWNRKQKEDTKHEVSKSEFQVLPQFDRLIRLRRQTLYAMRRIGLKVSQWNKPKYSFSESGWNFSKKSITNGYVNHVFGTTWTNNKVVSVSIQSYLSLNRKLLYDLRGAYHQGVSNDEFEDKHKKGLFLAHIFILSLRPLTANLIESVFSDSVPLVKARRYMNKDLHESSLESKKRKQSFITTYHFLSGIESEYQLKGMLDDVINNYIQPQINTKNKLLEETM